MCDLVRKKGFLNLKQTIKSFQKVTTSKKENTFAFPFILTNVVSLSKVLLVFLYPLVPWGI